MHHRRTLESFRRVLLSSLEEECSCGVSELYLQGQCPRSICLVCSAPPLAHAAGARQGELCPCPAKARRSHQKQKGSPLLKVCCCFSTGLNLTCVNSVVKVSGRVRARLPVQQQSIESWRRGLLTSPHPFSVDGRVLKTSPECIAPRSTPASSQSSCESEAELCTGTSIQRHQRG